MVLSIQILEVNPCLTVVNAHQENTVRVQQVLLKQAIVMLVTTVMLDLLFQHSILPPQVTMLPEEQMKRLRVVQELITFYML